jgi:tetratricopeptide (TPR) repeat protein
MLSAVLILVLVIFTVFFIPNYRTEPEEDDIDNIKKDPQLKKLWSLAQSAMRERKPLKAEKALLTILKFDEKNAAAYNRLGILYAKEKHYKEAIECFEIAQSLDNNASSLHNVGLIYYETGKFEKAAMAFSQAIEIEGDQPARYIAYAKALEKLGERNKAIDALETAYSLSPSTVVLRHLLELYENNEDVVNIEITKKRIEELQAMKLAKEESEKAAKTKRTRAIRFGTGTKADRTAARADRAAAKTAAKQQRATAKAERATARANAKTQRVAAKTAAKTASKAPITSGNVPTQAKKIAKKRKII